MGRQSSYREHDTHTAYEKAVSIVCDGIPFTMLSEQKQSEKRDEAYTLYNQLRQEVRTQLQQHFDALSHLHAQLTQEQFLHKPAIEAVMTESEHAAA